MNEELQKDLRELFTLLAQNPNVLVPIAAPIIFASSQQAELHQEQTAYVPQANP